MVTIATFGDGLEANLARGYLESLGIPSFLANEQTVGMAPHLMIAIGGIKLEVADEIEIEARTALADRRIAAATPPAKAAPADATTLDASPVIAYESSTDGDEVELEPTPREQTADRACRGAIICLFFPPLELYVLWLLIKVFISNERLGPRQRRRTLVATIINIPVLLVLLFWARFFVRI